MEKDLQSMGRLSNGKVAIMIIIASESVFFATLIIAYIALRGQNAWPVEHTLKRLAIPLGNTTILLLSALAAWRAELGIRSGKAAALREWLLGTLLLGGLFVLGQIFEFSHAGFRIDGEIVGGVFLALMGFHALHVLAGMVMLAINEVRTRLGDFSAGRHDGITVGTWFWYYVCFVWLVLFTALYLL